MRSFVIYLVASTCAGFAGTLLAFTVVVNSSVSAAVGIPTAVEAPKVSDAPSAQPAPKPAFPRYVVNTNPPFCHITDNETNREYIYINKPHEPSKLIGYVDLTQTGRPEIKATKFENGKWQDQ